jgi:nucleoside-diphosphate-sugar epimerase
MRVFVAGATGAIGRRLVPLLVSAGHSVVGLTHSPGKADMLRGLGAEAAVADGLDAMAVRSAVIAAKPDVIVHEMTDLKGADYRHFDNAFATSNRLRTEGTDYLLAAARDVGVKRFVAQSFCGWPYARQGGPIKTEMDPLDPNPPQEFRATLEAIEYLEDAAAGSPAPEGVVLRYGALYGPDTGLFEDSIVEQVRRRRIPVIGDGNGWWSFLQVDDAARATALAIDRGKPGHIYNIVDDDPAPVRDWLPALAKVLGAKPPRHVPVWLARLLVGEHLVVQMTEVRAGANAKAKRDLDWQPAFASWRQGFAEAAAQWGKHKEAA